MTLRFQDPEITAERNLPEDFNISNIDREKFPHVFTKYLNLSKKNVTVKLTSMEYNVTQLRMSDDESVGYTNFFEKGTYHCKVCDQLLFRSDQKVFLESFNAYEFPQFANASGPVYFHPMKFENTTIEEFN
jgi:hypothetical protein